MGMADDVFSRVRILFPHTPSLGLNRNVEQLPASFRLSISLDVGSGEDKLLVIAVFGLGWSHTGNQ